MSNVQVEVTYGGPQGLKGDTGSDGTAADTGYWQTGTLYAAGSRCYHDKSGYGQCVYRCKTGQTHTSGASTEPEVGASWADKWELFAEGGADGEVIMDGTPAEHDIMIRGSSDKHVETSGIQFETSLTPASDAKSPTSKAVADYVAALEETDFQVALDHLNAAYSSAGTWTASESTNALISTRTAAQADHYRSFGPIPLPQRSTAGNGAKLTSVKVAYTVGGTIDTANDVFSVNLIAQTLPADGSGASAAVLAGDDDADYDTAHNTNANRLASGSHTLEVTIPVGEQAYAADGKSYFVRIRVKDNSTANLTFVLNGITAKYSAISH